MKKVHMLFDRPEVKAYIESKSPKIATSDEILEYCSKIYEGRGGRTCTNKGERR